MGRLQKGINDLESWCLNNGSFGKQLMNEWTGECDDGTHYRIDEVARGSQKKFKWVCSKGHVPILFRIAEMYCPKNIWIYWRILIFILDEQYRTELG